MPLLEQVLRRAQDAGALRPDVSVGDLPMLSLMLGHVVDFAGPIEPELWRRYVALLLDGLRAEGAPLPGAALGPDDLDAAMAAWRPRRR
jgi:Transcriptional regulator SbtR-like, C-terminal domain